MTESDLERITFTIDVSRWRTPPEMSNRAARVLRWFAAAHRCGPHGYVGTRASYAAIGAAIARATHEPASRSTVIRAVDELVGIGLLDRSRGRGDRVRQLGPHEYVRETLAVLTLTAEARAIWSGSEPVSHLSPQVSKSNGYNLPSQVPRSLQRSGEPRPERTIEDASPTASAVPIVSNEGSRADASDPATAPAVAVLVPRQSARPIAPLATLADLERPEDGARQAAGQRLRFSSSTRPTTRAAAVAALLATLARVTSRIPIGAALCARAAAEIAGRSAAVPCGVEWDYWIARWPELARGERDRLARTELVPLLRPSSRSGAPPRSSSRSSPTSAPPAAREPLPPRPSPPPPACSTGLPAAIAEGDPDPGNPFGDVLARQLARLAERAGRAS